MWGMAKEMEKMPIPEGLDVIQSGDEIVIRRRWRTLVVLPIFFFLIFWFGFLGFWYYHALTAKHPNPMMLFFPLIHVAVGVGMAYFAVASLINRTDVIISGSRIRCITGPLPWLGNMDLPAADIHGLTVRERQGNKGSIRYVVMYVDAANREHSMLLPTPRREQADFIAASIRQILGLEEAVSAE
jgi:hypothetical protein